MYVNREIKIVFATKTLRVCQWRFVSLPEKNPPHPLVSCLTLNLIYFFPDKKAAKN